MSGPDCDELRAVAPELALSVLSGEERAKALEHTRAWLGPDLDLAELAVVAQAVLTAAPVHEPPPGFESRVLDALPASRKRRTRRLRRLVPALAATVLAAAAATWITLSVTRDERRIGSYYEKVLATANGRYFTAAELRDDAGRRQGVVFAYQGRRRWISVVLPEIGEPWRVAVATKDGATHALGRLDPAQAGRVWAHELPVDVRDIASISLTGADGRALVARLGRH